MGPRARRVIWRRRSQGTCMSHDTRTRLLGLRRAVTTRRLVRKAADRRGHEVFPTARRTTWFHRRPRTCRGPSMRRTGVNTPRAWTLAECHKHSGAACIGRRPGRRSITYRQIPWAVHSDHALRFSVGVPQSATSMLYVRYVAMFVGVLWRSTHKNFQADENSHRQYVYCPL